MMRGASYDEIIEDDWDESDYDEPSLTERLRELCDNHGIPWSSTMFRNGKPYASKAHTTIGRGARQLTFFEEDGAFECVVGMNEYEAFAAGVCAWSEG